MKILVTGAAGQVGVDLLDVLAGETPLGGSPSWQPDRPVSPGEFSVMGLTHHDLDLTNPDMVAAGVGMSQPDVIVNLAAFTAVDLAESEPERAHAVNGRGVGLLSQAAAACGARLITLSTDYVFAGDATEPYTESDQPHPRSVYGASKWAGEQLCTPTDTIVRTSWVMGVRGRSVVHAMIARARAGEFVRFVNDQRGTVTGAADLARALVPLLRDPPGGVWHVANAGEATWYDVAHYVGVCVGRDDHFATAIATTELDPAPRAPRPAMSALDTTKYATAFAPLPDWHDVIARLVRDRP